MAVTKQRKLPYGNGNYGHGKTEISVVFFTWIRYTNSK